ESGKRDGAVLAHGGGRPKELPRGYFLEPTIFCGVQNHIRIAQEEIFGPVVAVLPCRDPDEAIRMARDSTYGRGGMISSRYTPREENRLCHGPESSGSFPDRHSPR